MVAWESFGAGWVTDVVKQLKLDADVRTAEYGEIVDMAAVDYNTDVVHMERHHIWRAYANGDAIPQIVRG